MNVKEVKFKEDFYEKMSDAGYSLTSLAKEIGVSRFGLEKMIDRGTFKTPYMLKIAKLLNVDLNFFGNKADGASKLSVSKEPSEEYVTKIAYLERLVATKDEVIRAKDEIIATLKEKTDKK